MPLADAIATHGRVRGDTGAEERSRPGEREIGWDAEHKPLIDDDAIGVSAISDAAEVTVGGIERKLQIRAEILESSLAPGAGSVRVHQAADRGEVARFVFRNGRPDFGYAADDLMAWDNRGRTVGMNSLHSLRTEWRSEWQMPQKLDFDLDVVFVWIAPRDCRAGKRRGRTGSGIGLRLVHG